MILCGATDIKHLQAYNIVIVLCGLAVLGVGVWMAVDSMSFRTALENLDLWGPAAQAVETLFKNALRRVKDSAVVLIAAGGLAVVIGAAGILTTYTKFLLILYAVMLLIVVIMEVGAATTFAQSAPQVVEAVEVEMKKLIPAYDFTPTVMGRRNRIIPIHHKRVDNATAVSTLMVNVIQAWVGCCGAESGFLDYNQTRFWKKSWNISSQVVPIYCCKFSNWQKLELVDPNCFFVRTPLNSWMNTGCINKTEALVRNKFPIVTAVSVIAGLVETGAVIFAFGLSYSIGKPGYYEL
ncbi:tetraspanin-1-like isoform X2 [Paramacrobiotus metropolitanus]|uniref:tetraspanin-1-like isoform X2 n=2 Tax=Paramacrobiotus metropolitanus TaxID=2943436 RepID=UPI0024464C90|nr:tetraspanin-1-like isoform X2 [Paramacrobiotus metropolitanus]